MADRLKALHRLADDQQRASDPSELVWLSASAGTGKTHVLTARVLRLLLTGTRPEAILCLTFTKAGAAEMAERIHARLAYWVRLEDKALAKELFALGEPNDDDAVAHARALFAQVLDAPGGGLRIQTIHSFCQSLLGSFPAEAGLSPGFRPLEGRAEAALARQTLADLVTDAESGGELGLIRDIEALSRRLGEAGAESYLMRCARAPAAMEALGPGIEAKVRRALELPSDDVEKAIEQACHDHLFDCASLKVVAEANARWGTKTGRERAEAIAAWLGGSPADRASMLHILHGVWAKADGDLRSFGKGQAPPHPEYPDQVAALHGSCAALLGLRVRAALADLLSAGLRAGQAYARAYAEAKRAAGVLDFDDLIRLAERLLVTPGMGEWVRYKLDQATDHILVDEAQDTNNSQWSIVAALAAEFFAGDGARGTKLRTIFTVGDYKQAIFGFQGTNPVAFGAAGKLFAEHAAAVEREFLALSLDRSFRSTPPVLALVDLLIADLGADALGLADAPRPHVSARDREPGRVTLWRPVSLDTQEEGEAVDAGEEGWIDDATRLFATKLARQIRAWLDDPFWVVGRGRPLRPEDIMILVRSRKALASLIVARLHAEGVPVAGVDRLRLNAPLPVRDLLAAIRFVLQPNDDLSLAGLLVSPLFGLSQEALYRVAFGRTGSLWQALRASGDHGDVVAALSILLAQADFTTPYGFLEAILTGALDGRRKLIRRLGIEARDPIEELLNAALSFEGEATPSLQGFLDWFDRGAVEITRDPSAPLDAVRVMTVHGSKGLQAPLVILADATADPEAGRSTQIDWGLEEGAVPVLRPRKEELVGTLASDLEEAERRERQEHWRLLYVAATRAEERLVVGGALGPRARGVAPATSWYTAVERAMEALGAEAEADLEWGGARHFGSEAKARVGARVKAPVAPTLPAEPEWLRSAAPVEARPPRPLAPSSLGVDTAASPPPSDAMRAAARRGELLHALFERLPALPPAMRTAAAARWLERAGGVADSAARDALVADACAIIVDPRFADLFGPDSLAEAPIAAVVEGQVIAGTVDRLRITADEVQLIDFKTARRVPASAEAAPEHHLRQMAAYAAALSVIFPGRRVTAALLYTAGPTLLRLPPELLAMHKPGFAGTEQKLPLAG